MCDVCKTNPGTVFLSQIVDGAMRKVNLCEPCSKETGVSMPAGFGLADLLLGICAAQRTGIHALHVSEAIREADQSLAVALAALEALLAKLRADAESAATLTPGEQLALIAALVNAATEYMTMHNLRSALAGLVQALCKLPASSPQELGG